MAGFSLPSPVSYSSVAWASSGESSPLLTSQKPRTSPDTADVGLLQAISAVATPQWLGRRRHCLGGIRPALVNCAFFTTVSGSRAHDGVTAVWGSHGLSGLASVWGCAGALGLGTGSLPPGSISLQHVSARRRLRRCSFPF